MSYLTEVLARGAVLLAVALLVASVPSLRRVGGHGAVLTAALVWTALLPALLGIAPRVHLAVLPGAPGGQDVTGQRRALLQLAEAPPPAARDPALRGEPAPSAEASAPRAPALAPMVTGSVDAPAAGFIDLATLLAMGYVLIAAVLLGRRLASASRVARLVREATLPVSGRLRRLASEAARLAAYPGDPPIRVSPETVVPFVAGALRPTIVLPVGAEGWGSSRLRAVLVHELAHLRRRDTLMRRVADVACAVHWANPLVWFVAARLRDEAEIACDAAVISAGVPRELYARELVALARGANRARLLAHAVGIVPSTSLRRRVEAILAGGRARAGAAHIVIVALLGSSAGLAALVVSPTVAVQAAAAGDTLNISDGGPEISSNSAGVQARWTERGRHAAVYVTGGVDLTDVRRGVLRGSGRLLLLEETAGGLAVFEWRPGDPMPIPNDVTRALTVGAQQLSVLTGTRGAFPGSTLGGLPAWSDDPVDRVLQAGWLAGDERYGLALRGLWHERDGMLTSDDRAAWLVVFAYDRRRNRVRRLQLTRAASGELRTSYFIDGAEAPVDDVSRRWALESVRALDRLAAADVGPVLRR